MKRKAKHTDTKNKQQRKSERQNQEFSLFMNHQEDISSTFQVTKYMRQVHYKNARARYLSLGSKWVFLDNPIPANKDMNNFEHQEKVALNLDCDMLNTTLKTMAINQQQHFFLFFSDFHPSLISIYGKKAYTSRC